MTKKLPRLAVLDDEVRMRKALRRLLQSHGFQVEIFAVGEDLLAAMETEELDCLLLDLHMPGINGFDVLKALDAQDINLPVIVITGHDEPQNAARVRALGASAYLTKPLDASCLLAAITQATAPNGFSPGD
jgi:FixJ family two-component response regulator